MPTQQVRGYRGSISTLGRGPTCGYYFPRVTMLLLVAKLPHVEGSTGTAAFDPEQRRSLRGDSTRPGNVPAFAVGHPAVGGRILALDRPRPGA